MAEIPIPIPPETLDGLTPQPLAPILEFPPHLTKRSLRQMQKDHLPESEWGKYAHERGDLGEQIALVAIFSCPVVKSASLNKPNTPLSDIDVRLIDGYGVDRVKVEVKVCSHQVYNYKEEVRATLPKGKRSNRHLRAHFRDQKTIIVNAGEKNGISKTREDILNGSFLPQLRRIRTRSRFLMQTLADGLRNYETSLAAKGEKTQIFPEVPEQPDLPLSA